MEKEMNTKRFPPMNPSNSLVIKLKGKCVLRLFL
jgi:hypothetical protein